MVIIGIAIVMLGVFKAWNTTKIALAQQCQAALLALGPNERLCLQDMAAGVAPCTNCDSYNAAVTRYNAGQCKDYGPVGTYVCPPPAPPSE